MHHDPTATAAAASIGTAVAGRDREQLAAAFTDTVRLRALLPGGPVESHGRDAVLARFAEWFAAGEPVADRLLLHYRLTLGQGHTRWACTQTLIGKTVGDRLATLDLLCSGFRPIGDPPKGDDGA